MAYRDELEVRNHLNCTSRALTHADATALAVVQIDFEAKAGAELFDRIIGADTEAVIALEAVAARHAATGFIEGGGFIQALDNFAEVIDAAGCCQAVANCMWSIGVVPGV